RRHHIVGRKSQSHLNSYMTVYSLALFLLFFFFQAEDGIRDSSVTGVQTCALPISLLREPRRPPRRRRSAGAGGVIAPHSRSRFRSEERRVGKECRSRWSSYN